MLIYVTVLYGMNRVNLYLYVLQIDVVPISEPHDNVISLPSSSSDPVMLIPLIIKPRHIYCPTLVPGHGEEKKRGLRTLTLSEL